MYLVPAWMTTSTPCASALKYRGVAQVLSIIVSTPRPRATLGDRGHVLDLEGERARRFQEDHSGVRAHQAFDFGADQRVVVGGLDPEAAEHPVAQLAGRRIGRIDHQQMIAGLEEGHQRLGDRRLARAGDHGAVSALQGGDRILQRERGRRAAPAVVHPAQLARRLERLDVRVENRGRAEHGRIDDAGIAFGIAARGDQFGVIPHVRPSSLDFPRPMWQDAS